MKYPPDMMQTVNQEAGKLEEYHHQTSNQTVRSVYSPLPEIIIVHHTMHDAREQQGRAVTEKFFQQQKEIASIKLQCMSQLKKISTPDPLP